MPPGIKKYFPGKLLSAEGLSIIRNKYSASLRQKRKKLTIILALTLLLNIYLFWTAASQNKKIQQSVPAAQNSPDSYTPHYDFAIRKSSLPHDPFDAAHPDGGAAAGETENSSLPAAAPPVSAPAQSVLPAKEPAAVPQLAGIFFSENNYSAIIIHNNEYVTVSSGEYFASYQVAAIDANSVQLRNSAGQMFTCRLKGF